MARLKARKCSTGQGKIPNDMAFGKAMRRLR